MKMTLESGMDELAPIKNMETPTIASMNRMIGIPELEWIFENDQDRGHARYLAVRACMMLNNQWIMQNHRASD
ncbi:hypothetical protein BGZ59_001599 [Podila verticillata]|nr:hypothetical protein BGZ59_001599 [Podila verticillata]